VTLQPLRADLERTTEDGWRRWQRWHSHVGLVELWFAEGSTLDGPVRVTGEVPHAVSPLEPYDWARWHVGNRTEAELGLVEGLPVEVVGHEVVFRMPQRGWSRDSRRVFVTVDGVEYVARPRAFASTQLVRPDRSPVWRSYYWGRTRLSDDATPVEVTVAALLELGDFHTRMVHQPINAI
jgi:hypothetical protein